MLISMALMGGYLRCGFLGGAIGCVRVWGIFLRCGRVLVGGKNRGRWDGRGWGV